MLEKKNYQHNKTVALEDNTVINGQGCGEVAKMKYGFFPMSYNGCEMIALHNSMVLRNEESSLKEVCLEMYKKCQALSGLFGSDPCRLGSFYKKRNIPYRRTFSYTDFFDSLGNTEVSVVAFWCKNKPFGGLHTVAVQKVDGFKIKVYNRYNNRDYPYIYKSRTDFLPDKSDFICGYLIEEGKKNG